MSHQEDDQQEQTSGNGRAGDFCEGGEAVVLVAAASAATTSTADSSQGHDPATHPSTIAASTTSSSKRKADTLSDDGKNIIDILKKQRHADEDGPKEETNESFADGEEEVEHEVDLDALLDGSDPDVLVVHGYDKASVLATAAAAAAAAAALASSTGAPTSNTALTTAGHSVVVDGSNAIGLPTRQVKTESTDSASGIPRQHMWDTRLKELMEFRALTGHCLVPKIYPPNPPLGRWVGRQRSQYKLLQEGLKSRLTEERISKLQQLGFVWYAGPPNGSGPGPAKRKVDKNQMQEYPRGHQGPTTPSPMVKSDVVSSQVTTRIEENTAVSPVTTQGEINIVKEELDLPLPLLPPLDLPILPTNNTLQSPQISAVAASFSSPGRSDQWELRFQDLLNYKAKHGTCRVPRTVPVLGRWVKKQREHNRRRASGKCTNITLQRLKRLDDIDFVWECSQPDDWQTRYLQLIQYKEIHGNCLVPKKHSTLGRWVGRQRSLYKDYREGKQSSLTPERINLLSEIDFAWSAVAPNSPDGKSKLSATASASSEQHHGTAAVSPENNTDLNVNSGELNVTANISICKDDPCPSTSQQSTLNAFPTEESVIQV